MYKLTIYSIFLLVFGVTGHGYAATLRDAHLVFQANFNSSHEGVYTKNGLIFVVAEPKGKETYSRQLKARAMLRSYSMIKEFVCKNYFNEGRVKPCPEEMPLSTRTRILRNKFENDSYRYVIALSADELKKAISER